MEPKTFEEAKAMRDSLEAAVAKPEAIMNSYPKGPMGLTVESVRLSPEFRALDAEAKRAFAKLREFNAWFVKAFKTELQAERRARRGG